MEKKQIKEGILYLLQQNSSSAADGMGYTLLEIKDFLKLNTVKGYFEDDKQAWKNLKELLSEMEEEGLVEERHFDAGLGGRVDYSIENPGIGMVGKNSKILKDKWKIN